MIRSPTAHRRRRHNDRWFSGRAGFKRAQNTLTLYPISKRTISGSRAYDLATGKHMRLRVPCEPDRLIRAAEVRFLQLEDQVACALRSLAIVAAACFRI